MNEFKVEIYIQITVYVHPSPRQLCAAPMASMPFFAPVIRNQFNSIVFNIYEFRFPLCWCALSLVHWTMSERNRHFRHSSFERSHKTSTGRKRLGKTIYCHTDHLRVNGKICIQSYGFTG